MLKIDCPYCGPRPESEFRSGGQGFRTRPAPGCPDNEWSDYLYFRENPRGSFCERWLHSQGCGQWIVVKRDTVTHLISSAAAFDAPRSGEQA